MSDDAKPPVVRVCEDHYASPTPAIVQTVDGEEWAVDHVADREHYLRLINYETPDCETVREVVDVPHRRIEAVQRYPLADHQTELLQQNEEEKLVPDGGGEWFICKSCGREEQGRDAWGIDGVAMKCPRCGSTHVEQSFSGGSDE